MVTAKLNGLSHQAPQDLDIALVAPSGPPVMLISDDSNNAPTTNATLVFTQEGSSEQVQLNKPFPSNATSVFDATSRGGSDDNFAPPGPLVAPGARFAGSMGVFLDESANGAWKLFVKDDVANGKSGSIAGGWTLEIEGYELLDDGCDADAGDLCGADDGGVFPKFKLALAKALKLRKLLKGLNVKVTVPHPQSKVKATLRSGKRVLGTATKKDAGPGVVPLKLKLRKAGRKYLAKRLSGRRRRTKLKLSTVADPPGSLKSSKGSKALKISR